MDPRSVLGFNNINFVQEFDTILNQKQQNILILSFISKLGQFEEQNFVKLAKSDCLKNQSFYNYSQLILARHFSYIQYLCKVYYLMLKLT